MLDAREFADAIRLGVIRGGLDSRLRGSDGRDMHETNYLPLATAIVEYLKSHLEVTLPAGSLMVGGDGSDENDSVTCEVN